MSSHCSFFAEMSATNLAETSYGKLTLVNLTCRAELNFSPHRLRRTRFTNHVRCTTSSISQTYYSSAYCAVRMSSYCYFFAEMSAFTIHCAEMYNSSPCCAGMSAASSYCVGMSAASPCSAEMSTNSCVGMSVASSFCAEMSYFSSRCPEMSALSHCSPEMSTSVHVPITCVPLNSIQKQTYVPIRNTEFLENEDATYNKWCHSDVLQTRLFTMRTRTPPRRPWKTLPRIFWRKRRRSHADPYTAHAQAWL